MKTGPTPDDKDDNDDDHNDDGDGDDNDNDDVMQEVTYRVQKAWGEPFPRPRQPLHLCCLILAGCQPGFSHL